MNVSFIYTIVWWLSVVVADVMLTRPMRRYNPDMMQRLTTRTHFQHPLLRRRFDSNYYPTKTYGGQAHTFIPRLKTSINLIPPQHIRQQTRRVTSGVEGLPQWVIDRFPQGRQQRQYGFCDRKYGVNTMLSEVKKLFPGRFMSEAKLRVTDEERRRRRMHIRRDQQWEFNPDGKIRDTSILSESEAMRVNDNTIEIQRTEFSSPAIQQTAQTSRQFSPTSINSMQAFVPSSQGTVTSNLEPLGSPQASVVDRPAFKCEPTCCETEMLHVYYENVTIDGQTYSVINLPDEKQFMNVGFCPDANMCSFGSCFQHYTTQYIVIWNVTVDYWPPVDVTRHDFPSHCSWIG